MLPFQQSEEYEYLYFIILFFLTNLFFFFDQMLHKSGLLHFIHEVVDGNWDFRFFHIVQEPPRSPKVHQKPKEMQPHHGHLHHVGARNKILAPRVPPPAAARR